mmetsp:Transcript_10541/g.64694  ORF Transcript_10541/g.64694 Transcript_10541/m.64694 type:complete len:229 (-) Transcript_10541:3766-4452(-)
MHGQDADSRHRSKHGQGVGHEEGLGYLLEEELCSFQAVHVQVPHELRGRPHLPEHHFSCPGDGQQRSVFMLPFLGFLLFHGQHQHLSDLLAELGESHLLFVSQVSQHRLQALEMFAPSMLALVSILQLAKYLGLFVQCMTTVAPTFRGDGCTFHGFQQRCATHHFVRFQPHVFQRCPLLLVHRQLLLRFASFRFVSFRTRMFATHVRRHLDVDERKMDETDLEGRNVT